MFVRLPLKYHREDNNNLSGAACAQMVLYQIGKGMPYQQPIANEILNNNVEAWNADPTGVMTALNNLKPAGFQNYFVTYSETIPQKVSRKIVWTIHHYKVAPAALVFGTGHGYDPANGHWVVVTSFDVDKAPTSSTDTAYKINAFEIHNPWTATSQGAYQHGPSDKCGLGVVSGKDWGRQFEYVTYSTPGGNGWLQNYMTGVPFQGSQWEGKFVAVCDPDHPGEEPGRIPPIETGRIITPDQAVDLAVRGLRDTGLETRDVWQHALAGTTPGRPVLVERMDLANHLYYIVPFEVSSLDVPVLVNVDAYAGGTLAASLAQPRGSTHFGRAVTRDQILGEFVGMDVEIGEHRIRLEERDLHPHLVWIPCRESESPYWPFYLFNVGGGDFRIYVRIDGEIFTELHGTTG